MTEAVAVAIIAKTAAIVAIAIIAAIETVATSGNECQQWKQQ